MRHRSAQEVKRGARVLATTSIMTVAIVARPVRIEGFAVNSKTARAARAYLTSESETSLMQFAGERQPRRRILTGSGEEQVAGCEILSLMTSNQGTMTMTYQWDEFSKSLADDSLSRR